VYPAWANQPTASSCVMASTARRTASSTFSRVQAPSPRSRALILENACSMDRNRTCNLRFLQFSDRWMLVATPQFKLGQVGQESNLQPAVLETAALPN
jgi:hypothetical protein